MLAPNSPLRARVTALAQEATTDEAAPEAPVHDPGETDAPDQASRSPARYLWATLIARLFKVFPLTCRRCGAEMQIIAFVTEAPTVRTILDSIGEPSTAPPIAPARRSPAWEEAAEASPHRDPLAQPEPEYQFNQEVDW